MRLRFAFSAALVVCLALPAAAAITRTETVALVVSAEPRVAHLFDGPLSNELARLDNVAISTPEVANWIILVKAMPIKSGAGADIGYYAAAVTFLERVRQFPTAAVVNGVGAAASVESIAREPEWANALRDQVLLVVGDSSLVEVCREIAMKFETQVVTSLQSRPVLIAPPAAVAPQRAPFFSPPAKAAANVPDDDAMLDDGLVGPPLGDEVTPSFTPPDRVTATQPAAAKAAPKQKAKKSDVAAADAVKPKAARTPPAPAGPLKPAAAAGHEVAAPTGSLAPSSVPPAPVAAPQSENRARPQPVASVTIETKVPDAPADDPALPPERALLKTAGWFKPASTPAAAAAPDPGEREPSAAEFDAARVAARGLGHDAAAPSPVVKATVSAPEPAPVSSVEKTPRAPAADAAADAKMTPRRIGDTPALQPMASVLEAARSKKKASSSGTVQPPAAPATAPSNGTTSKSGAATKQSKTRGEADAARSDQLPGKDGVSLPDRSLTDATEVAPANASAQAGADANPQRHSDGGEQHSQTDAPPPHGSSEP